MVKSCVFLHMKGAQALSDIATPPGFPLGGGRRRGPSEPKPFYTGTAPLGENKFANVKRGPGNPD